MGDCENGTTEGRRRGRRRGRGRRRRVIKIITVECVGGSEGADIASARSPSLAVSRKTRDKNVKRRRARWRDESVCV